MKIPFQDFGNKSGYTGNFLNIVLKASREERKLRVFENMVLRRIFGPRKDEVTGQWRRKHTEEFNDL